jgi:DNA-damage-inducible protein D
MALLGYVRWENFEVALNRAVESCKTTDIVPSDHFREVTKMVALGSGANRPIKDYMLTRYACYLIAQNGDPKKEEIAFAQCYFAVQTRKQEIIEERIHHIERTEARDRLKESEKQLPKTYTNAAWTMKGLGESAQRVTRPCLADIAQRI